jgi:hypothetical protein
MVGGNGELPMKDAQRYRMNAAECLSAAEQCGQDYRSLTLAIAVSWLSLARHQEAMDDLLVIWSEARSARSTVSSEQPFRYPRDLHRLAFTTPARRRVAALSVRESISS